MINVTVNGTEQIKCNKGDNLYQVLTAISSKIIYIPP